MYCDILSECSSLFLALFPLEFSASLATVINLVLTFNLIWRVSAQVIRIWSINSEKTASMRILDMAVDVIFFITDAIILIYLRSVRVYWMMITLRADLELLKID
jgi:hypothetical protein